jgi:glycosyltransferase involved in cell wall biosynthesis
VSAKAIPRTVAHFGKHDPRDRVGGVATFAKNLELVFERVEFMTGGQHDFDWVKRERVPVICDNHWVSRVPRGIPVIGFQHGMAFEKFGHTRALSDLMLAVRQGRAASRPNTLWVACAEWIGRAFAERHGNRAHFVVYHQVDLERFDGRLDNRGSRLVLHDARNPHKGSRQMTVLQRALPEWRFEGLACAPAEVPERLRKAAAFVHLSRYEGNSIVCNEAMAQNLPCLFTRVGLFRDASAPTDVIVLDPERAFRDERWLIERTREFLRGAATRGHQPRRWVEANASLAATRARWRDVIAAFDALPWPS